MHMSSTSRSAERKFHDALYTSRGDDSVVVPPEVVQRYTKPSHPHLFHLERLFQLFGDVRAKKALYLGCGVEASSILLALKGAKVVALDLSLGALQQQRKMAAANGVAARVDCVVAAADGLPFRSGYFDLFVGIGIWHHLQRDLLTPCAEVGACSLLPRACPLPAHRSGQTRSIPFGVAST
jgi:SAM-dependent methyltransferase